jgi:hypothetical protein
MVMFPGRLLILCVAAAPSVLLADDVKVADSIDVSAAIRELDAEEFAVRDEATRHLIEAGAVAIGPLAQTAREGSPEAAARSLEVLNRLYAANQDLSFDATEGVLFELMASGRTATRDRASRILDLGAEDRLERTVARLKEMGGLVKYSDQAGVFAPAAIPNARNRIPNNILITRRWTGGDAGLKQLLRLYHLPRLRVYRTKQAPVSEDALDAIVAEMGNIDEIQVRGEGYLGISASQPVPFCTVSNVEADSGAAKAGIREGDIILSFDGHEIRSFQELIELLMDKSPGDKVPVVFSRNGEEKSVEVELTEWK